MVTRKAARQSGPQRRQTILDAAATAFAARGYHMTTMREIAAAAGVTKPVLYDHFASKQHLYITLIESARDDLSARGARAMQRHAPPMQRIRTAIESFFSFVGEHPAAARVLFTPPEGDLEIIAAAYRVQTEATARLVALLAPEPDLLPDAPDRERRLEIFMEFLKSGLHGLATWWTTHPETPREMLVDAAMDLAWNGLSAQFTASGMRSRPV